MRAFVSLLILCTLASSQDFTEEVRISQGRLRGKRVHQDSRGTELAGDEYLGIPFASPPVGDLRWAPPQPPKTWEGLREAVDYAAGCPQYCLLPHIDGSCPKNQSEDCLYLNIWTPLSAAQRVRDGLAAPFPVMFWIHGGGFTEGSASCTAYYGLFLQNLTNQVVVTVNYRLAALGFLMTPSVGGNFGIEDQRLAMQWVKANIAQFGGNPDSVTIFGESAGGMSVSTHLVSPLSAGLFHKALMESNPVSEYHTQDEGMNIGKDFCSSVGCDGTNLTCLRALSIDTILSAGGSWEVTIDGSAGNLPDVPLTLFKAGSYNKVPTVLGTNKEEAAIFLSYGFEQPMSATEYENIIRLEYPQTYKQVLQLYPPQQDGDNRIVYSYLLTHQNWACPGAQIILSISKYNPAGMSAFVYYFEHIFSVPIWHEPICQEAVCHAEELAFVWNTTTFVSYGIENPTPDEIVLTERMMTYWGQFSATGNPTISTQAPWPAFVSTSNISMVLDTPNVYTDPGHLQVYCNFWDAQ